MLQFDGQRLEKLYTPEEVWTLLRISQPSFYRHVREGRLQVVRVGAALRVREATLRDVLANGLPREKQAVAV